MEFCADINPNRELSVEISALAPTVPSYTYQYVAARCSSGDRPCVLSLQEHGRIVAGCTAFMNPRRLNRTLEIVSVPEVPAGDVFWEGLLRFCKKAGVASLLVNSFASASTSIPKLPGETKRWSRSEYVLALQEGDLWKLLRKGHKHCVNKGRKAELEMRRGVSPDALDAHAEAVMGSKLRRARRGENTTLSSDITLLSNQIRNGAGELFQAILNDKVVSSSFVYITEQGAYYGSAGTTPEGMQCGASHFLLHEIMQALKTEGKLVFNLGGAIDREEGLQRFKAGFGAVPVQLEAANFFVGGVVERVIVKAVRLSRGLVNALRRKR